MDVAIISSGNGGVGSFTFNLARNLGKYVDSVDLYLYTDPSRDIPTGEFPDNVRIVMSVGNPVLFLARTVLSTHKFLNYDIIHNVVLSPYALLLLKLSDKFGFSVVNTVHPMQVELSKDRNIRSILDESFQKMEKKAQSIVSKKTHATVTVSEDAKRTMEEKWDVTPEVIYHGVDKNKFSPNVEGADEIRRDLGVSDTDVLFFTVGILYPRKDISTLINAIPIIVESYENCKFLIIGRGPEEELMEKLIEERGVSNKVSRIRYVEDITKYFAAADGFILPSYGEEFGIVYVEAMQSGLPVIATDINVAREVVGDAGVFFVPGDPNDLADKTINILNNEGVWKQLVKNGVSQAQLFSWEKAAQEYAEIYNRIAK
jgi:teichuronic acid biosynthesis glycosyltransferase TuaC